MYHLKSKQTHQKEVSLIQEQLSKQRGKLSLVKKEASNALHNADYKRETKKIDLSSLNKILTINSKELWVTVEPRMTVRELSQSTLKYGLIPPVIPEFSSITVGGAIMGAALESSSHRYGQFNDTALEYELLLGDGTLIEASPEKERELFYAMSGSYGSLAILTLVKLKLIRAQSHVRLTYSFFNEPASLLSALKKPGDTDFLEGILFSNNQGAVIRGDLAPFSKKIPQFRQNHTWSPWFYQHVFEAISQGITEEQMPLEEYLFRLDRGAFWMGRYLLSFKHMFRLLFKIGLTSLGYALVKKKKDRLDFPSPFFRFLFGWAFLSRNLYKYWHRIPSHITENLFFIHDFYVPENEVEKALDSFLDQTKIFPVWLCPIKGTDTPQFLSPHYGKKHFINIGLYGVPQKNVSIPQLTAQLEKEILDFGGRKMLYSHTYYDPQLFSKIYENDKYRELRKKYCAENVFLSLYNKVIKSPIC